MRTTNIQLQSLYMFLSGYEASRHAAKTHFNFQNQFVTNNINNKRILYLGSVSLFQQRFNIILQTQRWNGGIVALISIALMVN
jgi:hypothetical protein